jgi:hypothetical protein
MSAESGVRERERERESQRAKQNTSGGISVLLFESTNGTS